MSNGEPSVSGTARAAGAVRPIAADLQLTASGEGAELSVSWRNTGTTPLKVATHVFAGEKHFDWLTVTLTDDDGQSRTLTFTDDRDESAPVIVDLAPGATTSETIDLAAWAARTTNGARALAPGRYRARIVYDSTSQSRAWAGLLEAAAIVEVS